MENLKLSTAYARYGAKVARGEQAPSAIAADGAVVLQCHSGNFGRTQHDVLRYADAITSERVGVGRRAQLGQHLLAARDGSLPVRLVIVTAPKGTTPRIISVRPDLVGKVTEFDGDRFVVDFSRLAPLAGKAGARRKR